MTFSSPLSRIRGSRLLRAREAAGLDRLSLVSSLQWRDTPERGALGRLAALESGALEEWPEGVELLTLASALGVQPAWLEGTDIPAGAYLGVERVVSGGQTGADQGGLRGAQDAAVPTAGWAPKGWLTEDGPAPWLAALGLLEYPQSGYPPRTRANVRESDATLLVGRLTGGTGFTWRAAEEMGRPRLHLPWPGPVGAEVVEQVVGWLARHRVRVINVAGSRESGAPGIGAAVRRLVRESLAAQAARWSGGAVRNLG
ncbi:MAG TPA: putative molybdenum carrier protein [bacterium]|nr:putative molybdenum carrier protein [bacterium]